tara:strand:+ start:196 stop:531 length:336 start_codon:yes stop_codon:yes gene_type:complete
MAQDFKRYAENNVGTAAVDIPNGSDFASDDALVGVHISNIVTASIAVDVYIASGGNDIHLVKSAPIPPGSALQILDGGAKIVVQSGDRLYVKSDTATSADVWISVVEAISE